MYSQIFLMISVRGSGLLPTTSANAGLNVSGAMKAAFGFLFAFLATAFFAAFLTTFLATFFAAFFTTFLAAFLAAFFAVFAIAFLVVNRTFVSVSTSCAYTSGYEYIIFLYKPM